TLLKTKEIPFYQKTSAGCEASLSETKLQTGISKKACDHSNKLAIESIEKINPTIIVIAQANNHEEQDWLEITERISSISNAKVMVVGPVSQWKPSLPKVIIKPRNWNNNEKIISDIGLDLSVINTDKVMNARSNNSSYEYISLISKLCRTDDFNNYYCRVRTNDNDLLQVDYGHLSKSGSLFVVDEILAEPLLQSYYN
ncbi:MAG: SGNH hydrolase domain-containing protein, partial [Psychrobacter sp.]|nr:SGNH hydrolase domain-containing protein [Psychrobacter sp.]